LVVDTDVIAAAVLGEPGTGEEAARLLASPWELSAPSHWKAELANVLWKAVRLDRVAADDIDDILSIAEALPITSVDVGDLWRGAVARAVVSGHPAYDVLFVELAARLGTCVASYDQQLQKRFPSLVKAPAVIVRP
jgi:predicted nucleic acid-binding protein